MISLNDVKRMDIDSDCQGHRPCIHPCFVELNSGSVVWGIDGYDLSILVHHVAADKINPHRHSSDFFKNEEGSPNVAWEVENIKTHFAKYLGHRKSSPEEVLTKLFATKEKSNTCVVL